MRVYFSPIRRNPEDFAVQVTVTLVLSAEPACVLEKAYGVYKEE